MKSKTTNNPNKLMNEKNVTTNDVADYNDQLGENASEEFRSENYANALKNETNNRGLK